MQLHTDGSMPGRVSDDVPAGGQSGGGVLACLLLPLMLLWRRERAGCRLVNLRPA